MKTGLIRLVVASMMVTGVCALTQDNPAPKPDAGAKPHQRTEWKGVLSTPATNAVAGVVAVLTVKRGDVSKAYNLTCADAEVSAKVKDAAAKGATMVVKGELNKDETVIAVTKMQEPKASNRSKPGGAAAADQK